MTTIYKIFFSRNYLDRLPQEDRDMITRNAAAAKKRMKARGDNAPSEIQVIRKRRRVAAREHAST
jgi:hypothetical protein